MTKSIILLSGGLDSLASLGIAKDEYKIELALTFDYGQKSAVFEIEASKKICDFYQIKHEVIKLDFLKNITQTSLVSEKEIPKVKNEDLESEEFTQNSAKSVWVPNRNGLFLNIAASYADSYGYDYILFGANKEEGTTFPDNTQEFIDRINESFSYSTLKQPKVYAPLIKSDKNDIVKLAIEHNVPLQFTRSCYSNQGKSCGICESCVRLKNALMANDRQDLIGIIF